MPFSCSAYLVFTQLPVFHIHPEEAADGDVDDNQQVDAGEDVVESGRLLHTSDE